MAHLSHHICYASEQQNIRCHRPSCLTEFVSCKHLLLSRYLKTVIELDLNHRDIVLDCISEEYDIKVEEVNMTHPEVVQFRMWKTPFPWHTKDMDLCH